MRHLRLSDLNLTTTMGTCKGISSMRNGPFHGARIKNVFPNAVMNDTTIFIPAWCPGNLHILDLQNRVMSLLPTNLTKCVSSVLLNRERNRIYVSSGKELIAVDTETAALEYIAFNRSSTGKPKDGAFPQASTGGISRSISMLGDSLILYGEANYGALRIIDLDNQIVTSYCKMILYYARSILGKIDNCQIAGTTAVYFSQLQQRILISTRKGLLGIDVDQKLKGMLILIVLLDIDRTGLVNHNLILIYQPF